MGESTDRWISIDDGAADATEPVLSAESSALLDLLARLRSSHVRLDRMSCADVAGQLSAAISRPIDTILCSSLDADPTAPLNLAVASDHLDAVSSAVEWLAGATGATRLRYVVDRAAMPPPLENRQGVMRIGHAYPQLHPSLLLRITLRRRLSPGRLPTDAGVIAIDAAAAWVLWQLIRGVAPHCLKLPWVLHDLRMQKSAFVLAPAELEVGNLARAAGLLSEESLRLVTVQSGPRLINRTIALGTAVRDVGEWTAHFAPPVPQPPADPCTRCGWCHAVCPAGVEPVLILEAAQACDRDASVVLSERAGIDDCVRCGLCQFVCPSRLPLLRAIDSIATRDHATASAR
jgi:electron transport complex protein RnfC